MAAKIVGNFITSLTKIYNITFEVSFATSSRVLCQLVILRRTTKINKMPLQQQQCQFIHIKGAEIDENWFIFHLFIIKRDFFLMKIRQVTTKISIAQLL